MEKSPFPVYRKVIYLVPSEGVKRGVERAADEVGLTGDQIAIRSVFDSEGNRFTGKAWEL